MAWPSSSDYNEAVQLPRSSFADPELRNGSPRRNSLGLPRPMSGAFGDVYEFACGQRQYAVKLFTKGGADQQQRYTAISAHLSQAGLPYTVSFRYAADGIRIKGAAYPILKMEWVQGEPINQYVEHHLNAADLNALAHRWAGMVAALGRASIAHGDLQHGNVLVVNGDLKLVDYDGMYVPALNGLDSSELGHPNYQHPSRTEKDFGPHLDRFSAWVIYVSLAALCIDPGLWHAVTGAGDEALLFRRSDFEWPDGSSVLELLLSHRDRRIRDLGGQMKTLCACPGALHVPPLKVTANLPSFRLPGVASAIGAARALRAANPLGRTVASPAVAWPSVKAPASRAIHPTPLPGGTLPMAAGAWRLKDRRNTFVRAAGVIKKVAPDRRTAARRLLLMISGLAAAVLTWSYLGSCASVRSFDAMASGRETGTSSTTQIDPNPVSAAIGSDTRSSCRDTISVVPPLNAAPVRLAGGKGRLQIDFVIAGVQPCRDSLRFHIAVKRDADRTLAWHSDRPNASRIYLLAGRRRYRLLDMGGVFAQDVVMQPQQQYEGWLEFERPAGPAYILVYPDIEPLKINLEEGE